MTDGLLETLNDPCPAEEHYNADSNGAGKATEPGGDENVEYR